MKCPKCDAGLTDQMQFCPKCGASATPPAPTRCRQCGASSPPDAAFCSGCGQALGQESPPAPPPPARSPAPAPPPRSPPRGFDAPLPPPLPPPPNLGPPKAGEDRGFLIVFLWGVLWGAFVILQEGVAWVSLNVFDYDLLGTGMEPLKLKILWVFLGVVAGWMAGIGIGVAARWANVAGGCLTLFLGAALLFLLGAVELGVTQAVPLTTNGEYLAFMAIDAFLCAVIGFVVALCTGRSANPVGFRAVLAIPFWVFASVISTLPFFPPMYEEIWRQYM